MFKLNRIFNENVSEFILSNNRLTYLTKNIMLARSEIVAYDIVDHSLRKTSFDSLFWELNRFDECIFVNVSGQAKSLVFNSELEVVKQNAFSIMSKFDNLIVGIRKESKRPILAFYIGDSNEFKKLQYPSSIVFIGITFIYCVKQVEFKNDHIYAYDKVTGNEKWLHKIETSETMQLIRFLTEYNNAIYFYNKEDKKVYALDTETGQFINHWKFKGEPKFYENKIFSFGYFYEELNLDSMKFTEKDMLPEYKNYINYPQHRLEGSYAHIGHGLGFVSAMKSYDKELGSVMDFAIYAVDLSTYKIVWSHTFEGYRAPDWKQLEYDGKRLYLLGQSGNLYIFEKEEKA